MSVHRVSQRVPTHSSCHCCGAPPAPPSAPPRFHQSSHVNVSPLCWSRRGGFLGNVVLASCGQGGRGRDCVLCFQTGDQYVLCKSQCGLLPGGLVTADCDCQLVTGDSQSVMVVTAFRKLNLKLCMCFCQQPSTL